jgi:hypothetical protein
VTGGLIAFLLLMGRTFLARTFTHEQAVSAVSCPTTGTLSTLCGLRSSASSTSCDSRTTECISADNRI